MKRYLIRKIKKSNFDEEVNQEILDELKYFN